MKHLIEKVIGAIDMIYAAGFFQVRNHRSVFYIDRDLCHRVEYSICKYNKFSPLFIHGG